MKTSITGFSLIVLALAGFTGTASAALIAHENFNYTLASTNPDPDAGLNSGHGLPATNIGGSPAGTGTGLRGNWGADQTVVAGLSYSNAGGTLVTSANALKRTSGTGFSAGVSWLYRFMATDPFASYRSTASANWFGWNGSYATELYYSVLLNWSAINTGANNRLVVILGRDNGSFNTYLAQNSTVWEWGDQNGASHVFGDATAGAGQTVLIVCRLGFNSATSFTTDYWFNPTLGVDLPAPDFSMNYTTTTSGGQFSGIQTRDGANILTVDEFRLGQTASSVMPMAVSAPAAPSGLAATANSFSEIGLTWTDNSGDEVEFVIERSLNGTTGWRQIATPTTNSTSYTDTGLSQLTTYYYRIRSENGGGASAVSATASVTTPSSTVVTTPPSGLVAVADSFSEITLTWTDNTLDETGFVVERSPDGTAAWETIATVAPNVVSYQNISLTELTQYFYRVYATALSGNSLPSNVANATTPALPADAALNLYLPFNDGDNVAANLAAPVTGFTSYTGVGTIKTASALSYPGTNSTGNGLQTAEGRYYITLDTTLPGFARYVSGGQIGGSGLGVLYVRWLARGINGQEANDFEFRTAPVEANSARAIVGTTFGNDFIRAMASSTPVSGINTYVSSALTPSAGTDLYVARFTFAPDGVTTMDVFVNQLNEGTPDASVSGSIVFNTIGFTKFGPAALPSIDEIRIAKTYDDAVAATGLSAYDTWAGGSFANPFTNTASTVDFDLDGLTNFMEFVFGGDPTINDSPSVRPSIVTSGSNMIVTFNRSDASQLQPVTVKVQVSSDLATWNPADDIVIGAGNGSGPNGVTYTVDDTGSVDTVVVTIPIAGPEIFARVNAQ